MSWEWITNWRGLIPRSWASVDPATDQPCALGADPPFGGHEHVVELDLVELSLAGRLDERVDDHAVGVHVDDEGRDALLALRRVGI